MEKLEKVEVIWVDAWSEDMQVNQEFIDGMEPVPRQNVGYLKKKTKTGIVLVGGIVEWNSIGQGEDKLDGELFIPRGMIKKIVPQKDADD